MSRLGPFARLVAYRGALRLLTSRHLKLRYRRSMVGFVWTLAYPALSTIVLTVVFAPVFDQIESYPLYAMAGVLVWHFVSVSCLQASDALLGAAPIARKVYVPTVLFPVSIIAANVVNLLLCFAVLPVLMMLAGVKLGFHPWLFAYAIVTLGAFTAGLALALAAMNVFFHDVRYLFEALLLVWFYATPVVYPATIVTGVSAALLTLNPLYWILEAVRASLDPADPTSTSYCVVAGAVATASLLAGWRVYSRAEARFHLYF